MSKATKRKHVTREVLEDYILPDENQQILKILGGRGNNLHEAQTAVGEKFLISMPTRFRKNVWIKRGDFVLADPITEGDKVKAEIVAILYPKQIKYIKQEGLWPEGFEKAPDNGMEVQDSTDNRIAELTRDFQNAALSEDANSTGSHNPQEDSCDDDDDEDDYSSEDNDDDLFVNTNRPTVTYFYSDSSEDEDEEEKEEGGMENEDGRARNDNQSDDEDGSADR